MVTAEPFEFRIGQVLAGQFRIVEPIGQGGMGRIYRVEQLSTGRQRALKVLTSLGQADARSRERFELEARVGSRIESEHVVEVIAAGMEGPQLWPWLVMELLDGLDLRSLVERRGRLSVVQTRELMRQLVHGLAAAHRAGVIHRDLKPENVFVTHSLRSDVPFTVKLLDFGIAKLLTEGRIAVSATSMVGTPLWIAPEQLNRGQLSVRTDIWALGLLVFFALTGHSYWDGALDPEISIEALITEILMSPLPRASERAAARKVAWGSWSMFDDWFARCVARDPERRFSRVDEAGDALGRALDSIDALPHEPGLDELLPPARSTTRSTGDVAIDGTLRPSDLATELRTATPSEPSGAAGIELLVNDYYRVVLRSEGIIHVQRTDQKVVELDEFVQASDQMVECTNAADTRERPMLVDFRVAPPRNDPVFEKAAYKYRAMFGEQARPIAYLMGSAIGTLQMQRLAKSVSVTVATFLDEAEAVAYLCVER